MCSAGCSQQHSLQSGEPGLMPASPAEAVLSARTGSALPCDITKTTPLCRWSEHGSYGQRPAQGGSSQWEELVKGLEKS